MEGITFLDQVCLTALLCRIQSRKTLLSKIYYILNKNKENTKVSKFLFFLSLSQDYRVLASREREKEEEEDDGEVGAGCGSVYSLHCWLRA